MGRGKLERGGGRRTDVHALDVGRSPATTGSTAEGQSREEEHPHLQRRQHSHL